LIYPRGVELELVRFLASFKKSQFVKTMPTSQGKQVTMRHTDAAVRYCPLSILPTPNCRAKLPKIKSDARRCRA
jgi:hypothetical protein